MNEQSILHDHIILSHSSLNIYNIYYQANNKFQFGAVLCEWKPSQRHQSMGEVIGFNLYVHSVLLKSTP